MEAEKPCPFCKAFTDKKTALVINGELRKSKVLFETKDFFATHDLFPVTDGHMLIISKRHFPDLGKMSEAEWKNFDVALKTAMDLAYNFHKADGLNVGINVGESAGQTVMHFHCHVFPRKKGDVENPKGGIRNFKKPLVAY